MKKIINIAIIFVFLCVIEFPASAKAPIKTTAEIRAVQTHYYNTPDTTKVMKAIINTLQDNGFIIQNGEMDLGYLRAQKVFRAKRTDKARMTVYSFELAYYGALTALSFGADAPFLIIPILHMSNELDLHPVIIDSNINVEKVGNRTKVRFTMIEKILENADGYTAIKASPRKVIRHYEQEIYQEFFNQVETNLFIEKSKI